ncbi:MAG: biotin/lipoyl-containing protein [Planctomycetota bacterium]|jgi:biotin carboxyl carrier protein|nr:biotin/lipoyl-containing protein [Planctomycetota bacterium]MDP6941079.1 biotin/lipoyl-containing protein [Planctomycetota bacterium]
MPKLQLELLLKPLADGSGWELCSPGVGLWGNVPEKGDRLDSTTGAGTLFVLNRAWALILPKGVQGFVDSSAPEQKNLPLEYGQTMLRILREGKPAEISPAESEAESEGALQMRAPQAGRFYRRPDPSSPLYAEDGDSLSPGKTVGLLEVMKTFNPVKYPSSSDFPESAVIEKFLVQDGEDVQEGQPLLKLRD